MALPEHHKKKGHRPAARHADEPGIMMDSKMPMRKKMTGNDKLEKPKKGTRS